MTATTTNLTTMILGAVALLQPLLADCPRPPPGLRSAVELASGQAVAEIAGRRRARRDHAGAARLTALQRSAGARLRHAHVRGEGDFLHAPGRGRERGPAGRVLPLRRLQPVVRPRAGSVRGHLPVLRHGFRRRRRAGRRPVRHGRQSSPRRSRRRGRARASAGSSSSPAASRCCRSTTRSSRRCTRAASRSPSRPTARCP